CDCGTSLASGSQPIRVAAPSEREADKLRQEGWSEWRIRRLLAQKAAGARRRDAARKEASSHARSETERWVRLIGELLHSRAAEWMGVLVHKYRRGLVSEPIVLEAPKRVGFGALTEDTLLEMKEDSMLIVQL